MVAVEDVDSEVEEVDEERGLRGEATKTIATPAPWY
jgi:hypothetical protein